jgi:hypothetical protein
VERVRVEGKIHRKYDEPRTPFQRVMESYESLNVAAPHRRIEALRDRLLAGTEAKNSEPAAGRIARATIMA